MTECPNCGGKVRRICDFKLKDVDMITKEGLPVYGMGQCKSCQRVLVETPPRCKNCGGPIKCYSHAIGVSPGWHHIHGMSPSCMYPEPEEKKE